jgi:hypothetical protein
MIKINGTNVANVLAPATEASPEAAVWRNNGKKDIDYFLLF